MAPRHVVSGREIRPRKPRRAVLIVCEGAETEPRYFEELRRTLGLAATVDVVIEGKTGYTDPIGLVVAAQERRQRRMREARRSNTLVEFEDVRVVFDVEHPSNGRGPNIDPAVAQALNFGFGPQCQSRASRFGIYCMTVRRRQGWRAAPTRGRI